ncbi:MAG: response regulator transcription factor [Spirulina sp. SIO3F2]|nr:response regulator transcription factor [Spirulina sp. SIO3F2]
MTTIPKLLLVDDEPGLREAVQVYLEDDNEFAVTAVASAAEAWDALERDSFELVISDIMMPEVDGYQFLDKLRADPRFGTVPVVFLTARGMTSDRILGYQAGCDAYLPKPFEPDELMAIVRNLLARRATPESSSDDSAKLEAIARELATIKSMLNQNPSGGIKPTASPIKIDLTPREQSVLDLVAQGLMNKEIASQLETSVRNVEKYVSRLFSKTGTNSRTELVRYALEYGLTQ